MRLCDRLITRTRNKHLYAQPKAVKWIELRFQEKVLCNSLETVNWLTNPAQVMLCETCGIEGCASDGYVHISRLGDYVLWTPPKFDEHRELGAESRLDILSSWGSLLFPSVVWKETIGTDPSVYPVTTRQDLLLSWQLEYHRYEDFNETPVLLSEIQQCLISGSHLDNPTILLHLERLAAWFEAAPTETLRGKLVQADSVSAQIETLHLDEPAQEWPALAIIDGKIHPAFRNGWVYLDEL